MSMVSCQKGPTRHAYAWQIGPFRQDTLDIIAFHLLWVHRWQSALITTLFVPIYLILVTFNYDRRFARGQMSVAVERLNSIHEI